MGLNQNLQMRFTLTVSIVTYTNTIFITVGSVLDQKHNYYSQLKTHGTIHT